MDAKNIVMEKSFLVVAAMIIGAPQISAANPVWSEDFDSMTPGSKWKGNPGLTIMENGGVGNSRYVRVEYDLRQNPPGTTVKQFSQPIPAAMEYTLQYDMYFEENWNNNYGGKFHGLKPDEHVTGCKTVQKHTWSARMVLKDRSPNLYLYDQKKGGGCGRTIGGSNFKMDKLKWYSISYYLKVNSTANASDGEAQIYVNGKLMTSTTNIQFRGQDGDATKIKNFFFSTFLIRNSTGPVVSRQYIRYDNFAVLPGKAIRQSPGSAGPSPILAGSINAPGNNANIGMAVGSLPGGIAEVTFALNSRKSVNAAIYNKNGELMDKIRMGVRPAGAHKATFQTTALTDLI